MSFELDFQAYPPPDGPIRYAYVPWDSELFGFPFFELKGTDIVLSALEEHLPLWLRSLPVSRSGLVYTKVPATSVAAGKALARQGFYPVETMLTAYQDLSQFQPVMRQISPSPRLRAATEADLPHITALAGSAFREDRFHLDPELPSDKADQRYQRWVENGFRSGDLVFAFEEVATGSLIGFFQARQTDPGTIDLSLAAVDPKYKGTGLGGMMYEAAVLESRERGYRTAETRIAVSNVAVLNLFSRLGFRFRNTVVTFHCLLPLVQ